ncbi:hypothetical protein K466DRAFT_589248 [Polyporus arcularius HHB13444]|uniref:DUF6533 domain-containing protein n=1 Tax=Polyporus arcularius HHB13444 TaxID=1314778 RepID=A0A5C3P2Z4_9APHY|nr:hypothetical protein K466DRAFT_589248 [Polyporus arcularius HHB13444]
MSSPSDDAQIVAFFGTLRTGSYVSTVPISLLIYDYVVTFDLEAELFWTRTFTGASLLFLSNRYIAIVLELFAMAELSFTLTDGSCNGLSKTASIMQDVRFLPWAAFAAMRGFALTKSRAAAAVIFTLSIAPLVVNLAQFAIGMTGIAEPIVGCVSSRNSTPQEDLIFPIVSRGGLIIADFILVVATWRTLGAASIRPSMTKMSQGSLAAIMLWNGLLYFVVLFMLNVLHLTFTLTSTFGVSLSFITEFTEPLTTILITRFLLDLQEANRRDVKLDSDDPLHFSGGSAGTLSFARAMGSIGEVIGTGVAREEEEFVAGGESIDEPESSQELERSNGSVILNEDTPQSHC